LLPQDQIAFHSVIELPTLKVPRYGPQHGVEQWQFEIAGTSVLSSQTHSQIENLLE
jgi:hypothetical protein